MPRQPRRKPSPPVLVTLGGEPWKVLWRRVRGCWGITCFGTKEIRIDPSCRPAKREREIVLHECLHAICPYLDEEIVASAAKELDDVLDAMDM